MRIRLLLALLALGLFITPSYADRKKIQSAPDTPETPPIIHVDFAGPIMLGPQSETIEYLRDYRRYNPYVDYSAKVLSSAEVSPIVRVKATEAGPLMKSFGFTRSVLEVVAADTVPTLLPAMRYEVPLAQPVAGPYKSMPVYALAPQSIEVTKTYSVADLVVPIPGLNGNGVIGRALAEPLPTTEKELIKEIQRSVVPTCWHANGGTSTLEYFPTGYRLVVHAARDVHEKIAAYIETQRKKLDTQISLEIRIITLSDALFGDLEMAKVFALTEGPAKKATVKFINDEQAKKFIERIQSDRASSVLMTPKITALDGQECLLQALDSHLFVTGISVTGKDDQVVFVPKNETIETGFSAILRPQLSADGTKVGLETTFSFKQLAETPVPATGFTSLLRPVDGKGEMVPFTQYIQQPKVVARDVKESTAIPVGRSVVMYAGKATVKSLNLEPLIISKIPYLSRLFKNGSTEPQSHTDHMIVVVTPRVIKLEADAEECEVAPKANRLTELLKAYHHACHEGKTDDARRLAIECLTLDPMCFKK